MAVPTIPSTNPVTPPPINPVGMVFDKWYLSAFNFADQQLKVGRVQVTLTRANLAADGVTWTLMAGIGSQKTFVVQNVYAEMQNATYGPALQEAMEALLVGTQAYASAKGLL